MGIVIDDGCLELFVVGCTLLFVVAYCLVVDVCRFVIVCCVFVCNVSFVVVHWILSVVRVVCCGLVIFMWYLLRVMCCVL